MGKNKDFDKFIEEEEYEDEFADDFFDSQSEYEEKENEEIDVIDDDDGDIQVNEYEEDEPDYEEFESDVEMVPWMSFLSVFSTWFMRLGILIAICLTIMFFITGKVFEAFIYIITLVVFFFLGYFFMYFMDRRTRG